MQFGHIVVESCKRRPRLLTRRMSRRVLGNYGARVIYAWGFVFAIQRDRRIRLISRWICRAFQPLPYCWINAKTETAVVDSAWEDGDMVNNPHSPDRPARPTDAPRFGGDEVVEDLDSSSHPGMALRNTRLNWIDQ